MSILSDKTIRKLCETGAKTSDQIRTELKADADFMAQLQVKADACHHAVLAKEVFLGDEVSQRYRAQTHGMISPFLPKLVREVEVEEQTEKRNRELVEWAKANPTVAPSPEIIAEIDAKYPPVMRKIISKGLTSYGYDVSLSAQGIKLFTNINTAVIDPKRFDPEACLVDARIYHGELGERYVILPPNSYLLGVTEEYFRMPRGIVADCLGKSTYARAGILINVTPMEPEWNGNVVIEIANGTPAPARIYLNEGIAQFRFFEGDQECEVSYEDRGGKYQGQTGVTLPKV